MTRTSILVACLAASAVATAQGPEAFPDLDPGGFQAVERASVVLDGQQLRLAEGGPDATLVVEHAFRHANGDVSVRVSGGTGGRHGSFTLGDGAVFGQLHGPEGHLLYTTDARGTWAVVIPKAGVEFNRCGMPDHNTRPAGPYPASGAASVEASAAAPVVDLLLIYNQAFGNRYPGAILETRLNHLVNIANDTMGNSGLAAGFRLVGHARFDYRNDNSNLAFRDDIAGALRGESRPGLAGLGALRDSLGADLVIGLRPHDIERRGSCGIAFFPENDPGFGASTVSDGSSSWSFCLDDVLTHEIGHNLGATHQLGAGGGVVDARGSAFVREGRFTTVMASFGTGRADRFRGLSMFSNPDLACGNEPCGNPVDTDNVTVIRRFLPEVAAYRSSVSDLAPPMVRDRSASDADGDGVEDWLDALPFDATERFDRDGDGAGDESDAFPDDPGEQEDTDRDGTGDRSDPDDDGDGVPDVQDAFPKNAQEQSDTDRDGVGDRADVFPALAGESSDRDGDGTGDHADPDEDGDGVAEFDAEAEDLLVISVANRQVLRFDAATGEPRGVEVPAWDAFLTFQSSLARRATDETLVYAADSGLRRLDLGTRELLGEWVPPFDDTEPGAVQLGSGFPIAIAAFENGARLAVSRLENAFVAGFQGQERARSAPPGDWRLDPGDLAGDITGHGDSAWVLGTGTRSLYRLRGSEVSVLAGPNLPWMDDPRRMTATEDGRLLVSDGIRDGILSIDRETGAFLGQLVELGPLGYGTPEGLAVTRAGDLLVAVAKQDAILAFDATTGDFLGTRVAPGSGGLNQPGHLILVPALLDRFGNDPDRQLRPNPGLWYNPASDGRGFDVQVFGKNLSVIWYTYDDAGHPSWLLASGPLNGSEFSASLSRFTLPPGGELGREAVGSVALRFDSERAASLSWTVGNEAGEESLQWLAFTPRIRRENDTGLWGLEGGPGWGVSLANQGNVTVAIAYLFDAAGDPRWVISDAVEGNPPYDFDMQAVFAPGLCPGCAPSPDRTFKPAGPLRLGTRARAAWRSDIVFPAPLVGDWIVIDTPIRRFSEKPSRPR